MRTPLCLIPEGDNVYTIVYTAWMIRASTPSEW